MVEQTFFDLPEKLNIVAKEADLDVLILIQDDMKKPLKENPNLKPNSSQEGNSTSLHTKDTNIFPKPPTYVKITELKYVDKSEKIVHLDVNLQYIPASQCWNGCSTNMKAACLADKEISLKASFTRCSLHTISGTIKRLCNLKTFWDMIILKLCMKI